MKSLIAAALLIAASFASAQAQQQPAPPAAAAAPATPDLGVRVEIEPAALALVKAMTKSSPRRRP